jgi:uncharacterized GH25 family protein
MNKNSLLRASSLVFVAAACTHHVKIEPSDKPFVVNLNVKIDHEVKLQIKEQNQDLLNLEDEVLSTNKNKKKKSG